MEALASSGAPDGPPKEKKGPAPTKQNHLAQVQAVYTAVSKLTMNYPLVNAIVLVQSGLGNNWAISLCNGPEASQLVGLKESIMQQVQQQRILGQGKKVPFLYEHKELGPLNARDMALGTQLIQAAQDKGYMPRCGADLMLQWLRHGQSSEWRRGAVGAVGGFCLRRRAEFSRAEFDPFPFSS